MASLGYRDGSSIHFDFKCAQGHDQCMPRFAQELVGDAPDAIVAIANEAIVAAASASATTPIVGAGGDLEFVALGLAKSLHHPGGNVTGTTISTGEAAQQRVAWLAKVVPALSKLVVLLHPANPANPRLLGMILETTTQRGVELQSMLISRPDDLAHFIRRSFSCAWKDGDEAVGFA
jgi:putative ABC transport system substrate-binding protein